MIPFSPAIAIAARLLGWVRDTWLGRAVAIVGAALLAALLIHRRGYKRGAAETKDYIDRASAEAAEQRRNTRADIDLDAGRVGAADRLRSRWSRD